MQPVHWYSSCGKLSLTFDRLDVTYVCHPGANDARVAEIVNHPRIKIQLDNLNPDRVMAVLAEYGAWDDMELADHAQNLHRLVWIALWDCHEGGT